MKRFTALLLVTAMLITCFALPAYADISVIQRKLVDAQEDNVILHEFEDRLGFNINYTWKPAENYASQCAIVVASGDYPDMMEYWCSAYPVEIKQMAEDGIIMPLNDLLEEYGQNMPEKEHPQSADDPLRRRLLHAWPQRQRRPGGRTFCRLLFTRRLHLGRRALLSDARHRSRRLFQQHRRGQRDSRHKAKIAHPNLASLSGGSDQYHLLVDRSAVT